MAVLTLVVMILLSLIVALLIKHSQQLKLINNNQNCFKLRSGIVSQLRARQQ